MWGFSVRGGGVEENGYVSGLSSNEIEKKRSMSASVIRRQNWNCPSEPPARKGGVRKMQFSLHQAQKLRPMCFLLSEKNIYLPI